MNQSQLRSTFAQQLPGAHCTMSCTRGGPALVDAPRTAAGLDVTGDPRRRLVPHGSIEWYRDDGGRSGGLAGQLDFLWRARTNLDFSLVAAASEATHDAFFYRWFGVPTADTTHITVVRIQQRRAAADEDTELIVAADSRSRSTSPTRTVYSPALISCNAPYECDAGYGRTGTAALSGAE